MALAVQDTPPQTVFVAHGLAKTYGSGEVTVHALRDVDLEIRRGEFVPRSTPNSAPRRW